jgi:hypothetical protein
MSSRLTRYRAKTRADSPAQQAADAIRPPGPLLLMLEGRAPWEFAALLAATPWLSRLPGGDGHPVVVFPGLGANDSSTLPLRRFLERLGYETHPWRQGFNFGPRHGVLHRAVDATREIAHKAGRPISLIGWSLGGVYAREIAKELIQPDSSFHPTMRRDTRPPPPDVGGQVPVRCVITLGSPFAGHPRATNAWRFYELVSGHRTHDSSLLEQIRRPPPVPTTSIFSRTDGIVAWQCCVNQPAPRVENIEVQASHLGLGMNPLALYAVADRLAQDPARWRPFDAVGARRWFVRPHHRDEAAGPAAAAGE